MTWLWTDVIEKSGFLAWPLTDVIKEPRFIDVVVDLRDRKINKLLTWSYIDAIDESGIIDVVVD